MLDLIRTVRLKTLALLKISLEAKEHLRPSEITSIYDSKNPTPDHVLKFISLVLITHKYGFASLESWGFDFVHRHCISYTDDSFSRVCAVGDLRQLLTMCQLTSDLDFERCRLLEERIGSHILFRALHNNPRFLERADALAISAEFGLRNIEGGMYYRILVEATKLAYETNQDVNYTPFLPTYLTAAQITCIHRGFISLIGVNERFHWDNAEVPCSCELDCSEAARSVLAQVNAKSREDCLLVDVLGQLHYMEEIGNLSRVGAWSGVSTSCEVHILEYIAEINDKVVGALGDYFLGILQPQEAGLQ